MAYEQKDNSGSLFKNDRMTSDKSPEYKGTVLIDGVEYFPATPFGGGDEYLAALELRLDSDAGDNITVRQYLYELLKTLWAEGEAFSGKRPFGNSGWEYDLYKPLIAAKLIDGELDADGLVNRVDKNGAHKYIHRLIKCVFFHTKDEY